jgi:hypothetical protein
VREREGRRMGRSTKIGSTKFRGGFGVSSCKGGEKWKLKGKEKGGRGKGGRMKRDRGSNKRKITKRDQKCN